MCGIEVNCSGRADLWEYDGSFEGLLLIASGLLADKPFIGPKADGLQLDIEIGSDG